MATWEDNQYVIEAKAEIAKSKQDMLESQELFEKYADQINAINPTLLGWMTAGFDMDQYYDQMNIDNQLDWLSDSKRAYDNRVKGAQKAAETKKANKLALA